MQSIKRNQLSWIRILAAVCLVAATPVPALCESPDDVYSTWEIFEVDKLASIWLIKRFINPDAAIKLYPKGDKITEGVPFDTPDAKFRRYHNISTFEMFRRHHKIEDQRCIHISKIVHDIEINTWEKKVMPESRSVIAAIHDIISNSSSSGEIIEKGLHYFDRLHAR